MRIDEDFIYLILSVVAEIPRGRAASYKTVAQLAGFPNYARQVGRIMKNSWRYDDSYPCHRVVHSDGATVRGWSEQKPILESEGVRFVGDKVDMRQSGWYG